MLSEAAVEDFKRIFEEEFPDEKITLDEARLKAENLMTLVRIIFQPMTEERVKLHQQRSQEDQAMRNLDSR